MPRYIFNYKKNSFGEKNIELKTKLFLTHFNLNCVKIVFVFQHYKLID